MDDVSDTSPPEFLQRQDGFTGWVVLVEPDPAWPEHYAQQRDLIRAALGPVAVQVEHVGSTAVPDLAAKPIIDIVLVVADPADEGAYLPGLEAAGFEFWLREPAWHLHRLLKRQDPAVNLHVFGPAVARWIDSCFFATDSGPDRTSWRST